MTDRQKHLIEEVAKLNKFLPELEQELLHGDKEVGGFVDGKGNKSTPLMLSGQIELYKAQRQSAEDELGLTPSAKQQRSDSAIYHQL